MPRHSRSSLFGPIAFAFCTLVFAAGAAYTWWLDHRGQGPLPLTEVRAAPLSVGETRRMASVPAARPPASVRAQPAPAVVRKCLGADGVPVFTSAACPSGATLVSETTIEVPSRPSAHPAAATPPSINVANASATVVNQAPGYAIPDRRYRQDVERERAWDRCERAKVRAEAELAALRQHRKMSDIRRWENYAEDECAGYEILSR